jgi:heptosyltransferase-2
MNRILIVRTDRIGDAVLSTPAIKAARSALPDSYIAVMVSPQAREIIEGNPYLDEVIVFDKKISGGLWGTLGFADKLKRKHFDTALILHPVGRVHMILWLAGIKNRIGFDKKLGFFLTKRIAHTKQLGEKHERDYNFDILQAAGITTAQEELFVPVKSGDRSKIKHILKENGIGEGDGYVVMHPAASCPSKRWPAERFAQAADEIIEKFHKKIVIVAGANDRRFGQAVREAMDSGALDLSGDLSVGELAALLEGAALLVSNDSGPVHIAAALKVPVVAIFGRNQPGLSTRRWGPLGKNNAVLHRDVGCIGCLAHECKNGFKCLLAIETAEVVAAAMELLGTNR